MAFLSGIFYTSDGDEKRDKGDGNDSEDGDNEGDGTSGLDMLLEDYRLGTATLIDGVKTSKPMEVNIQPHPSQVER